MTTVLLIRHGRSTANAKGVLAGRAAGIPLDDEGLRQARRLAEQLRATPLAAVVHSPLERCVRTARAIVEDRPDDVAMHPEPGLIECDYGLWSGRLLEDLAGEPLWADVMERPSQVRFPQGEGLQEMADRALAAVARWREVVGPEANLALVSHGDVIKAILADALGQPLDLFQRIAISPGSVSLIRYGARGPLVVGVNLLAGVPALGPGTRPIVGGGA